MKGWALIWLLISATGWADITESTGTATATPIAESSSSSQLLGGSLFPQTGVLKTETETVTVPASTELKPEIQQLPQLVDKLKIEALAADSPYVLLPHRPNYVLPVSWQSHPNDQELDLLISDLSDDPNATHGNYRHLEAVFQISLKYPLAQGVLGKFSRLDVAYTNRSFWQSYSGSLSRPFRETNHEPEIILTWPTQNRYVDYLSVALNHQSNGQSSSLSRSWNRVIVGAGAVFPFGVVHSTWWWRMPESAKSSPNSSSGDDNPDITHYLGHAEFRFVYAARKNNNLTLAVRNNFDLSDNKGALELGYSFPINKKIKGYLHYFNGYGDSLIDYNRHQQRVGLGVLLSDWF